MTGVVEEFLALKGETEADVLAMQVGDFYEFFADDARLVADELDLKVSEKSSHGSAYPMAGVPLSELTPYLRALVERGYTVAVAEQRGEDDTTREVVRVATPGTLLEATDADARYLATVVRAGDGEGDGSWGLAAVDVTTGAFRVTELDDRRTALSELGRFDPAEVLPGPTLRDASAFLADVREATDATLTLHESAAFAPGRATHAVREQFGGGALDSVGLAPEGPGARAAGAALDYVAETGVGVLASLTRLRPYRADEHVALDATTRRNLELTETMHGEREGSLVETLDHTVTAMGGRRLAAWLVRPRRERAELERRLDCVAALGDDALARDAVRETLGEAYDLERLAARATSGSADAAALRRVADTLGLLPTLRERVDSTPALRDSPLGAVLGRVDAAAAARVREAVDDALVDAPDGETGVFARGHDDALDELAAEHDELVAFFDSLADREKARTGLSRLSVDRNRTDGYYLQVGNSQTDRVPERYREVKTLKNAKRYRTADLDEKERALVRVEEERTARERELLDDLRAVVADASAVLQDAGRALAELDALASFAEHAASNRWVRPNLVEGDDLAVDAGRHPVVERTVEFVPNDVDLDGERRFLVVTGPNMSGKSTYMRQTALIVLLAQSGSFVPADAARIGLVDGIYTRVGALDELAQGRSTFMVEMAELSNILHSATADSLVVLDEVGRGTATYDGISIAWAATEYLANAVRAKTLFATHYHELTDLADRLDGVENVHVAADERDGDVTFLHDVEEGPADRSYGVHVADLAGVPEPVVSRSRDVLAKLRADEAIEVRGGTGGETAQVVFDLGSGEMRSGGGQTDESDGDARAASPADDGDASTADGAAGTAADGGDAASGTDGDGATTAETDRDADAASSVLAELRALDVDETPPVEVLRRVSEWQEDLEDD